MHDVEQVDVFADDFTGGDLGVGTDSGEADGEEVAVVLLGQATWLAVILLM